jgi:uncharacterized ferredoxin-like protein
MSPKIEGKQGELEGVLETAKLMLVSARTAPKTIGVDDVIAMIVYGEEKNAIADKMDKIAEERKIEGFKRDAKNVRESDAVVLIRVRGENTAGLNCGACGHKNCEELKKVVKRRRQDFTGPICIFKAIDLGIAMGSAVKMASLLNVDNRIMYRIGAAASALNLMPETAIVMGIPLSAKGKNIYFDRAYSDKKEIS